MIPCPHYNLKIIGRSRKHHSAISSAAYQSGEKLFSELEHRTRHYPNRSERILHTEIILPDHAPRTYLDRASLWNSVEKNERQSDAQYARRFIMALPRELSYEENLAFVRQYCQEQFVAKGMCVDLAYHCDESANPHVHILTTMRAIDMDGKWMAKSRKEYVLDDNGHRIRLPSGAWKSRKVPTTDWNDQNNLEKWRHEWEILQNKYLDHAGRPERVDMRSFDRQQNDLAPTVHLGPEATAMEQRGIHTFLGDMNREIRKHNRLITFVKNGLKKLRGWLDEISDVKMFQEEQKINRGPSVHQMLVDNYFARINERKNWSTSARLKGMSKDMIYVERAEEWLKNQGILYADDLLDKLIELETKSKAASDIISRNDTRRKTIMKIQDKATIFAQTKPIFDTHASIFFKRRKEQFALEHADELKDHKRAYAFLMKNHDGRLEVEEHEFDKELQKMEQEDNAATAELESIRDTLNTLKKLKRRLEKTTPELTFDQLSLHEQIAFAQEQIRQQDAIQKTPDQHR